MSLRIHTDSHTLQGSGHVSTNLTTQPNSSHAFASIQLARKGLIHLHLIEARNVQRIDPNVTTSTHSTNDGFGVTMQVCALNAPSTSIMPHHTLAIPATGECVWN